MVSFQCEGCGDIFTKKKLDQHFNRCRAPFSCIDCMVTFQGTSWKSHTSCMSEAQKYQGALYKEPKKGPNTNRQPTQPANPPRHAYVEDANPSPPALAVPPPAPSPPPSVAQAEALNIYDFLSKDSPQTVIHHPTDKTKDKPKDKSDKKSTSKRRISPSPSSSSASSSSSDDEPAAQPLARIVDARPSASIANVPSDKKRKRPALPDIDSAPPSAAQPTSHRLLHSGLTGGLDRMLSAPEQDSPRSEDTTPHAATKRARREREGDGEVSGKRRKEGHAESERGSSSGVGALQRTEGDKKRREEEIEAEIAKLERKKARQARRESRTIEAPKERRQIEYHNGASGASSVGGKTTSTTGAGSGSAESFMKLVKGDRHSSAGSRKGQSVWGALKMWKEEGEGKADGEEGDKRLWKGLRMRVNDRGEVVLFAKED